MRLFLATLFIFFIIASSSSPHDQPNDDTNYHEDNHTNPHHVFNLSVHGFSLAVCATMVFAVSMIFEVATEKLMELVEHRHHFKQLINAVFQELTIMGTISFILFILKESGALSIMSKEMASYLREPDHESLFEVFEWIHMLIFFFLVGYVIIAFSLVVIQIHISHNWDDVDTANLDETRDRTYSLKKKWERNKFNLWNLIKYRQEYSRLNFLILRLSLITWTGAPEIFPFAVYLKYAMHKTTVEIMHVSPLVLLCVISVLWANWGVSELISVVNHIPHEDNPLTENLIHVILSGLLVIITGILWLKCELVSTQIADMYDRHELDFKESSTENMLIARDSLSSKELENIIKIDHHDHDGHSDHVKTWKKYRTETAALFWFRRPGLIQTFMQLLLYLQSITTVWMIAANALAGKPWYWFIIELIAPTINVIIVMPHLLGAYVKATYTSDFMDKKLINKAWIKQLKREEKKQRILNGDLTSSSGFHFPQLSKVKRLVKSRKKKCRIETTDTKENSDYTDNIDYSSDSIPIRIDEENLPLLSESESSLNDYY